MDDASYLLVVARLRDDHAGVGAPTRITRFFRLAIARLVNATSSATDIVGFWTMVTS